MGKNSFVRRKTYTLTWPEGAELDGLEVRATATSLRNYLTASAITDGDVPDSFEDDDGTVWNFKDNPDSQFEFIVRQFSKSLLDWNLTTEDGIAVPATEESLWRQDREFAMITIRAWLDALATVSRPLPKPSPAGVPLAGESIPMEPLSESLAS